MPTLKEISDSLSMPLDGDGSIMVKGPSEPKTASKNQLAIAMNENFVRDLAEGDAQTAIVVEGTDWRRLGLKGVLYVKKSRYVLAKINAFFEDKEVEWEGVHETSLISKETSLSENVSIGPFCIIGSYVSIGENSSIGGGVFIGQGAVIGKGAVIHSGVRIGRNVIIGDDFICQPNAVIGSDGFSFVSPDGGGIEQARKERSAIEIPQINKYVRISSLGSVIIGDDVEIGAGSVIDRGTIENTTIGNGTKLDNLVHVAHNVSIGENCLLCGQVGIAGSSKIGNRVVLGGQVGVADHISIGNDSIIAGKSGVSSNVPDGRFMMGNPAIKIENNIGSYKAFRRLPKIFKKIENLERILLKKK